jgi:hypothetical protein
MRNLIKLFAFVLFLGAILFPMSAFASSNTGAEISGEGAAPISGWTVSNIGYQLMDNSSLVNSVTFDLDAPATNVSVKLSSQTDAFTACANIAAYHWQCNFQAGVQVSGMDEFRVIAVGN